MFSHVITPSNVLNNISFAYANQYIGTIIFTIIIVMVILSFIVKAESTKASSSKLDIAAIITQKTKGKQPKNQIDMTSARVTSKTQFIDRDTGIAHDTKYTYIFFLQ